MRPIGLGLSDWAGAGSVQGDLIGNEESEPHPQDPRLDETLDATTTLTNTDLKRGLNRRRYLAGIGSPVGLAPSAFGVWDSAVFFTDSAVSRSSPRVLL